MIGAALSPAGPAMPDQFLIGNGSWCSTCFPDGPPHREDWRPYARKRRGCNECAGAGRIAFTAEQIVAETVAAKRQSRERRP